MEIFQCRKLVATPEFLWRKRRISIYEFHIFIQICDCVSVDFLDIFLRFHILIPINQRRFLAKIICI